MDLVTFAEEVFIGKLFFIQCSIFIVDYKQVFINGLAD